MYSAEILQFYSEKGSFGHEQRNPEQDQSVYEVAMQARIQDFLKGGGGVMATRGGGGG